MSHKYIGGTHTIFREGFQLKPLQPPVFATVIHVLHTIYEIIYKKGTDIISIYSTLYKTLPYIVQDATNDSHIKEAVVSLIPEIEVVKQEMMVAMRENP